MSYPLLDTDVIVRFITGDDPVKQAASATLFQEVADGALTLLAPVTVIADAVFVLASRRLYNLPRQEIALLLTSLLRYTGLRVHHRRTVMRALEIYGSSNLDFGDAMIAATMELASSNAVYSYDTHFDRIPGIRRLEP